MFVKKIPQFLLKLFVSHSKFDKIKKVLSTLFKSLIIDKENYEQNIKDIVLK